MGKQYNKSQKRRRRKAYVERKKVATGIARKPPKKTKAPAKRAAPAAPVPAAS
jgi:hypothetical protein